MSTKKKQFRVRAVISGIYSTTIAANSLDDALSFAKGMKVTDFVNAVDEYDDGEMEVQAVERDGWYPEIK